MRPWWVLFSFTLSFLRPYLFCRQNWLTPILYNKNVLSVFVYWYTSVTIRERSWILVFERNKFIFTKTDLPCFPYLPQYPSYLFIKVVVPKRYLVGMMVEGLNSCWDPGSVLWSDVWKRQLCRFYIEKDCVNHLSREFSDVKEEVLYKRLEVSFQLKMKEVNCIDVGKVGEDLTDTFTE